MPKMKSRMIGWVKNRRTSGPRLTQHDARHGEIDQATMIKASHPAGRRSRCGNTRWLCRERAVLGLCVLSALRFEAETTCDQGNRGD